MTGNTSRVKAEMQAAKVGLVKKESTSAQMSEGHLPQGSTQPQKQQGQESFHPVDSHSEAGQSQGSQLQECRSEQVIADPPSQSTQDSVQYTHDDHIYSSVQNHQQSGHDEEMQYTNHHSPEHEAGDDPGGFDSNTIPEIPESLSKEVQEVALQLVAQAQAQHLAQQKAEYAARAQAEAEARAQTEGDVHGNPEAQDPSLGIAISGEYREEMQHRVDSNHAENVLQVRIKDEDPDGESGLETTVRPNNLREDQRDQTLTDHGHLQDRGQDKTKEHATMPVDGESIERIGPALEDVALSEADAERPSEPGGNLDREPNEQEPPSAEPSEVVKSTHKSGNDSERLAHVLESSSAGRYTFSNNDTNVTLGPEGLTNGGSLVELNHGNDVEQWVAT
ncbi:hypothetical protein IE53DRAFT_336156 [Violaceomyces palustris]|uniref:Uncharacterized protein n=1 Tax=Violaceomyces palustris TaxID=1673888 RepID=A0ACD0NMC5_9BASI|nr:hypothetical protein IE53DRAFT_336156 [Violaceomyces palustris]